MVTTEIRRMIRESGKKHWQIAADVGVSEATLVRWLREAEMSQEHQKMILEAIERTGVIMNDEP